MQNKTFCTLLLGIIMLAGSCLAAFEPGAPEYQASLLQDLQEREAMPQSVVPESQWYSGKYGNNWGPMPAIYPGVDELVAALPPGTDVVRWKRDRLVAIARHYIGLPYRHHHIPGWAPQITSKLNPEPGAGLDCSNFTAWVYNFGFGIELNGDVAKQARMIPRGGCSLPDGVCRVEAGEQLQPADLLYIYNPEKTAIAHVIIYVDKEHIIDSTGTHVDIRHFTGWYRERFSHAVRIIV